MFPFLFNLKKLANWKPQFSNESTAALGFLYTRTYFSTCTSHHSCLRIRAASLQVIHSPVLRCSSSLCSTVHLRQSHLFPALSLFISWCRLFSFCFCSCSGFPPLLALCHNLLVTLKATALEMTALGAISFISECVEHVFGDSFSSYAASLFLFIFLGSSPCW